MDKKLHGISDGGRIYCLDFARGIAVFFMIMQHAMIMHEKSGGQGDTVLGNVFILLGTAPAAPVFIIIMGVFAVRSTKTVKENVIRGFRLFIFGYILNFMRFTFPLSLAGAADCIFKNPFPYLDLNSHELFHYLSKLFFTVDIFQLAGLSLIFFSFMKQYASSRFAFPALILFLLIISPLLWGVGDELMIFRPLWGADEFTEFPLFPWCTYFLFGMYLSKFLQTGIMGRDTRRGFAATGAVLGLTGTAVLNAFPIGDYYRSGLGIHLLIMSFVLLWLPLCDRIAAGLNTAGLRGFLDAVNFWSGNVTGIYIFQWVLYGWSMLFFGINRMTDYEAALIGFFIVILAHLLFKHTNINKLIPKL